MPDEDMSTRARIALEDEPHRAALEDNPEVVHVGSRTWASIGFLSLSFGPPIGLAFLSFAGVAVTVAQLLGGPDKYVWAVGGWSLASAVSFSLAGPLSDIFGRRNPILFGQVTIIVGCIVAGTAQSMSALIAGEVLIGFGTGFLFVSYAGVPEMLPNKWRSLGLGMLELGIGIPWGIANTLIGNSLLRDLSWRWIFYLGVIVEIVSAAGTALVYFPASRPRGFSGKTRWQEIMEIDFIGLFLFTAGLTTFLIGVTWGGSTSHPWGSVSTIVPIVVGGAVFTSAFFYEKFALNPIFPLSLLARFRQFSLLLVVVFVAGMNFYSMATLLPQGSLFMFSPNPIRIGVYALPNNIMQCLMGTLAPALTHKIGHVKWQLVGALTLQLAFTAATAGAVFPNRLTNWIVLPAIGIPMFPWVTILAYSIASLHVPYSNLGLAMGLLGTFRAMGGAVGNTVFQTIFNDRAKAYLEQEVAVAALKSGLPPTELPAVIPAAIQYNLGIPTNGLLSLPGVSPITAQALQTAVRTAYGHAFKITFYCTIPFGVIALVCSLATEDPTRYMTNHVQHSLHSDEAKNLKMGTNKEESQKPEIKSAAAKAEPEEKSEIWTHVE